MKGHEIRHRFLDYFVSRGHTRVASAPLVPHGDPTLLFVNAGMVPFKDVFTGKRTLEYRRATSSQKCLRVSGKHNDFENVGYTPRHHTFFEMLGNFSFGDYFKREAIAYAWEFLTEDLELEPARLWASVHTSDDEAAGLWPELTAIPAERVLRLGDESNFWAMGETGPCGPCSEIFYDFGSEYGGGTPADNDARYLEIWNLVFMQYERFADGRMEPLPRPSVDTGMGLERIAAVAQGVYSNFDTDLFTPILERIAEAVGRPYEPACEVGVSFRVLADHGRAATFLIGDGVYPSNEGRGYVLRRVIRRAVRHYWLLDVHEPVLHRIAPAIVAEMGEAYPDLPHQEEQIGVILEAEEQRFLQTIDQGMAILEDVLEDMSAGAPVSGDEVFRLYDTYGFPPDLTELIARERGHGIDHEGYEAAMDRQREQARAASKFGGGVTVTPGTAKLGFTGFAPEVITTGTKFVGYDELETDTVLERVIRENSHYYLLLRRNPFYATGGGQVADSGTVEGDGFRLRVVDVRREGEAFVPVAELASGDPERVVEGAPVHAAVDAALRADTERHHTVTHVLHAILRKRLGDHVRQAGSLVAPDRMRFDFSHPKALGREAIESVEDEANAWVLEDLPVTKEITGFDEAKARGAMALFGEKYGDTVRVVTIGEGRSVELCGGCHVERTGEIGPVRIVSESSVAGGVRRIEVVTGRRAMEEFRRRERLLEEAAERLKSPPEDVPARIERLLEEKREAEKSLEAARRGTGDQGWTRTPVDGVEVVTLRAEPVSMDDFRAIGDAVRSRLGSGVGVIGAELEGKANLLAVVSDDLIQAGRLDARALIKELAQLIGGGGGGKKHMAQAGGKDVERLGEALERAPGIVAGLIGA